MLITPQMLILVDNITMVNSWFGQLGKSANHQSLIKLWMATMVMVNLDPDKRVNNMIFEQVFCVLEFVSLCRTSRVLASVRCQNRFQLQHCCQQSLNKFLLRAGVNLFMSQAQALVRFQNNKGVSNSWQFVVCLSRTGVCLCLKFKLMHLKQIMYVSKDWQSEWCSVIKT